MSNSHIRYSYEDLMSSLERSQEYGFLSPQPLGNQIKHSIDFLTAIPDGISRALDLGAGGGLPSLVWLHLNPDIEIVALDAMQKRTNFLNTIAEQYEGLRDRFTIINGRAEVLAQSEKYREKFEVVVARGFGPPATTAECASGFLKVGGSLFVSGRPIDEVERWDTTKLEDIGLDFLNVLENNESHVAHIIKSEALKTNYPRSSKLIKKYPLW